MTDAAPSAPTDLSFEEALQRLETIVSRLESGQAPLEESITLYEEGARLKAHCESRLKAAQLRVEKIVVGPDIGVRRSSAQITRHYTPDQLVGRKVAAVVNFAPRQIGPFMSEVLTLGFPDADGEVVLVGVDRDAPLGGRLF